MADDVYKNLIKAILERRGYSWDRVDGIKVDHNGGLLVVLKPEVDPVINIEIVTHDEAKTRGNCLSCNRPFSPTHDASAPGPNVRHPFRSAFTPGSPVKYGNTPREDNRVIADTLRAGGDITDSEHVDVVNGKHPASRWTTEDGVVWRDTDSGPTARNIEEKK